MGKLRIPGCETSRRRGPTAPPPLAAGPEAGEMDEDLARRDEVRAAPSSRVAAGGERGRTKAGRRLAPGVVGHQRGALIPRGLQPDGQPAAAARTGPLLAE